MLVDSAQLPAVAAVATEVDPSADEAPAAGAGAPVVGAAGFVEPKSCAATAGKGAGNDANGGLRVHLPHLCVVALLTGIVGLFCLPGVLLSV